MRSYTPGDRISLNDLADVLSDLGERVIGLRRVGGDLLLYIDPEISTEMGRAPDASQGAPADPNNPAANHSTHSPERTQS